MSLKKLRIAHGIGVQAALIALFAATTALIGGAAAQTKPPSWYSYYMFENSNCSGQKDPINLMFYGAGYRGLSKVEEYLGWTNTEHGSTMYVQDTGQCIPNAQRSGFQQRETEPDNYDCWWDWDHLMTLCSWDHIRLWDGRGSVPSWNYYTGAGVHKDEEFSCAGVAAHASVDFDGPRDTVLRGFSYAGWPTLKVSWYNTANVPQPCGHASTKSNDGKAGLILLTVPSPTMFKGPASANLWVCTAGWPRCQGPGVGALALEEKVTGVTTFDWNHDNQFDGVGRYQYDVRFASNKVQVTSTDGGLLGITGRSVSCGSSAISGGKRFWCASTGSQPGPLVDPNGSSGVLATTWVTPNPSLIGGMTPAQNNGTRTNLIDDNCDLRDISGYAVPGSLTNGLLPYCYDTALTVRILEGDLDLDCEVTVVDDQMIADRYGACGPGLPGCPTIDYSPWFDLEPPQGDLDVDIKDMQKVYGRNGSTCQDPFPPQPPLP